LLATAKRSFNGRLLRCSSIKGRITQYALHPACLSVRPLSHAYP